MMLKLRSTARSFSFPTWSIPTALLALICISYGLRALSLGFYWDDWPYLWFFDRFGPAGIVEAFSGDRPFLSFIYTLCLSVLGHSPAAWQGLALLAHWLYSLGFWWMLAQTWPRQPHMTTAAAVLFAVYPGFTGHWITVIYGQAFLLFSFVFFSIGITLWAARRWGGLTPGRRAGWTLLALALSAFTMFSTEYFFGVELLRPLLLWIVLADTSERASSALPAQKPHSALRRAALAWLPYLALMIVFVIWRGFVHVLEGYQLTTLEGVSQSPLAALPGLALTILGDLIESSLAAWGQPLQLAGLFESNAALGLRWLAVVAVTWVLVSVFLARLCPRPEDRARPPLAARAWYASWPVQAVVVGVYALAVAGWPFWITALPLRLGFPQDRFTMMLSIGVCLIMAGLIDAALKDLPRKAALVGLLAALAAGYHFNTALSYREERGMLQDFFWQLTWRAPAVEENTLFLAAGLPFRYHEDDSLSAVLNWTYDPNGRTGQVDYQLFDVVVRQDTLRPLVPGRPIEKEFRGTQFNGSTSQVIVVHYAPPGCVRVLDSLYDADLYDLPEHTLRALPLSDPGRWIIPSGNPAAPPQEALGGEPRRRWCYYYERAELARQQEDWQTIVDLENDSIGSGFRPEDPAEYLPFIEGHARLGLYDDAHQLTAAAYQNAHHLRPALCAAWRRSVPAAAGQGAIHPAVTAAAQLLNCPIP